MYIDNPFWVKSIAESTRGPKSFHQSDNLFFVNKTTAMGHILNTVGMISLVAGTTYLDAVSKNDWEFDLNKNKHNHNHDHNHNHR